jgi:hypothetical protein
VSNNKRRHSLILAMHGAGDGSKYGDLGKVYAAVKSMHDGLAAGTGWTTEAGEDVRLLSCAPSETQWLLLPLLLCSTHTTL